MKQPHSLMILWQMVSVWVKLWVKQKTRSNERVLTLLNQRL